jgi:outer membrane lipoprotein carrier protein
MAVIAKSSIVPLNKAIPLRRFFSVAALGLTVLLSPNLALAEGESGAEQLRQFVRNSKTA